jgi:UDP-GlcNAc:undecaprenyl-phosphate GlcNAc-1-phosphate transferase
MTIWGALALVMGFALSVLFVGLYLGKVGVYEEGQSPNRKAAIATLVDPLGNLSHRRRIVEILLDTVLMALAYYSAYLLRFEGLMPGEQSAIFVRTLPLLVAVQILSFLAGGVYKGIWRYAGVDELARLTVAVGAGSIVSAFAILFFYWFQGPSRAVFILNGVLLLVMVGASRVSFRLIGVLIAGQKRPAPGSTPVLIYGAGAGGEILVRELLNNPVYCYQPVGFIDDDVGKTGKQLRGYRIFSRDDLPRLINSRGVSEVLVSSFKVPESKLQDLRNLGMELKRLRIHLD